MGRRGRSAARLPERILVVGGHHTSGYSMRRYATLLETAYRDAGVRSTRVNPPEGLSRRVPPGPLRKWVSYVERLLLFPVILAITSFRYDRIHFCDHSDALWVLAVPRRSTTIVTCHDLFAVRSARGAVDGFTVRLPGAIYQRLVSAGLSRAATVLAVSAATAAEVEDTLGRSAVVLHNPLALRDVPNTAGAVRQRQVLIVGNSHWRKNRIAGVRAWRALRRTTALRDVRLQIVGPDLNSEERLAAGDQVAAVSVSSGVSDERMGHLYRTSLAAVVASRYEGFGWPVVEANYFGCPVLCHDIAVLREVGGEVNVFADLEHTDEFTDAQWEAVAAELADLADAEPVRRNADRFAYAEFVSSLRDILQEGKPAAAGTGGRS